jgi:hypothetical protein
MFLLQESDGHNSAHAYVFFCEGVLRCFQVGDGLFISHIKDVIRPFIAQAIYHQLLTTYVWLQSQSVVSKVSQFNNIWRNGFSYNKLRFSLRRGYSKLLKETVHLLTGL